MQLYYRISDKSYDKPKLIGATKQACLFNFCESFAPVIFGEELPPPVDREPPMKIIADNCTRQTVKFLADTGIPIVLSEEGNAGSLRKTLELAAEECDEDELVYFCEDDYLHLPSAPKLLEEGIKRAEYVTLYDHPDKYTRYYNGGEYSKVIKTASSHWRYTCSTCMTFGVRIKTLKEDLDIWREFTKGSHPRDHEIFLALASQKQRRLAVPIPGAACHTDLEFSGRMKSIFIEPWAIQMMIGHLECELRGEGCSMTDSSLRNKSGWELLVGLDAIRQHVLKTKKAAEAASSVTPVVAEVQSV